MKVKYLDLKRQFDLIGDEIRAAIQRVLDGGQYILGEEVRGFESEWATFCEAGGAVGTACGTDSLTLALKASGAVREGKGDEVITTTLTAGYSALAIQLAGGVPVFADIHPTDYTIDPQSIEDLITPRTRAILPVHIHGRMADMPSVCYIAEKHGLIVVEDGSQAHGARLNGKALGAYGVAAGFSLYPTKNLGGFGDGGALIAHDPATIKKAISLRQGGHLEALQWPETGVNSRLDEMQAAILRVKLKHLAAWTEQRRGIAEVYHRSLSNIPGLRLPEVRDPESHVFHAYVVSHPQRDRLRAHLERHGVETLVHFTYLLHEQPHFNASRRSSLPAAERVREAILSLPLYPWMSADEIDYVVEVMRSFDAA